MNMLEEKKIKIQFDKTINTITSSNKKTIHFIPFNQESMTVTGAFDMKSKYKDFSFHAYTSFYDMDRNITITPNDAYVIVVPISSTDEKTHANLELSEKYSLKDYLYSLEDIPCYTIFINANFLNMHDLLCTLYSMILHM